MAKYAETEGLKIPGESPKDAQAISRKEELEESPERRDFEATVTNTTFVLAAEEVL